MNVKGQGSVEFLMTYGWAFLVMIAVIAGIITLDPLNNIPDVQTCSNSDFLICDDERLQITEKGEAVFTYSNNGAEDLTIQNISIEQIGNTNVNASSCYYKKSIKPGQTTQITCQTNTRIQSPESTDIIYDLTVYQTNLGETYAKTFEASAKGTPSKRNTILTGRVLDLDFTKEKDTIPDKSILRNNGVSGGGQASSKPTWKENCPLNGCYVFDGADDYIEILADSSHNINGSITVSAWMKSGQEGDWSSMWSGVAKYKHFILGFPGNNNNGRVAFLIHGDNNWYPNGYSNKDWWTPSDITEWNHYVGTYSEETNQIKIYGNGELRQTYNAPKPPDKESSPIHIGHREIDNIGNNHLDASITGVKIYNRSLSAGKIRKIYNLR